MSAVFLLGLWGALSFFTLGLVAAKAELVERPPMWRYLRSVLLAPVFVWPELKSFRRVYLQVREEHRADLLSVLKRRLNEYSDRDLREHLLYVLQLLDADEAIRHWTMSPKRTEPIVAVRVHDAALPGTDLVDFVAYMAAAAGMSEPEALALVVRLKKCYESKRLMPRSPSVLN